MIAKIVPLARLPNTLWFFDYAIPPELLDILKPGQLVEIPFRKKSIPGVVWDSTSESDTTEKKSILQIFNPAPLLEDRERLFAEQFASFFGTSLSVPVKMLLPPVQKKKIAQLTPVTLSIPTDLPEWSYHLYSNQQERIDYIQQALRKNPNGQHCIFVPEIADLQYLRESLTSFAPLSYHSRMSTKNCFSVYKRIIEGEPTVLITTRNGLFLPFRNLQTCIIDKEYNEQHKNWDQHPRFHALDVARLLLHIHRAQGICISHSPSVEHYPSYTRTYHSLPSLHIHQTRLIDLTEERKKKNYSAISDVVEEEIHTRWTDGDILFLINRKGSARQVSCRDCGLGELCPSCRLPLVYYAMSSILKCHFCAYQTALPLTCPKCGGSKKWFQGMGTESVEKELQQRLPTIPTIRVDQEVAPSILSTPPPRRRCIVGTQMALRVIDWKKIFAIVLVDANSGLRFPEFNASEHTWHTIREIQFQLDTYAPKATLYIQTYTPSSPLFQALIDGRGGEWYEKELEERKKFSYPPFSYLARILIKGKTPEESYTESKLQYERLQKIRVSKNCIIHPPILLHPPRLRGMCYTTIILKISKNSVPSTLAEINSLLCRAAFLDPNPIALTQYA